MTESRTGQSRSQSKYGTELADKGDAASLCWCDTWIRCTCLSVSSW